MKEFLEQVLLRACVIFFWILAFLIAWNVWPTDGTPSPEVSYNHFQMRHNR